ncbi:hypothetical protein A2379_00130 [Candidatus Amesbacteria bacterium RIFOXYB1_FULL_47_13]|nr:MAG: hypothetical protein UX46_C0002G0058 [Candidatus Amesbacteria bacterium GW2011_GWC1_46_24]OGD05930.1 MAG: hypothetical protein A2379_00130 [Candidatus Amesbacteria bacterium RIFOXYB1_FULL_47_13]HBC73143.1 hypothetical protein [Candidatus Amesbacteria bacterium]
MGQIEELRRAINKNGWRGIGMDIDHTICDSGPVWDVPMQQLCEKVARECGVSDEEIWRQWRNMNDAMYLTTGGVHPRKYHLMASKIAHDYNLDPGQTRQWAGEMRRKIYTAVPDLYPGTRETIATLKEAGLQQVFVTHAPPGLNKLRMKTWGFENTRVFSESTLRKKDYRVWAQVISSLNIFPWEMVAVGDSWPGDMQAARDAGIEARVWVKPKWEILRGDYAGEKVPTIEHIGQLVQAIIDCFG